MNRDFIKERGRAIEEAYFKNKNQLDISKYQEKADRKMAKQFLRALMHVSNDEVLEKALDHGVEPGNFTAIVYLPLVLAAWSDSVVERAEINKIIEILEDDGITKLGAEMKLIKSWLTEKPSDEIFEVWLKYINCLRDFYNDDKYEQLKKDTYDHSLAVAKSSGLLGIPSVSASEREFLNTLRSVMP